MRTRLQYRIGVAGLGLILYRDASVQSMAQKRKAIRKELEATVEMPDDEMPLTEDIPIFDYVKHKDGVIIKGLGDGK